MFNPALAINSQLKFIEIVIPLKFAFTCQNYVNNTNIYNEMFDIIKIYVPTRNEIGILG